MFLISSCEQFARIASWRMNRLKSSLISFSVIVIVSSFIVAVAGFEPATSPRMGRFNQLSFTTDLYSVNTCVVSDPHRGRVSLHVLFLSLCLSQGVCLFTPLLRSAYVHAFVFRNYLTHVDFRPQLFM